MSRKLPLTQITVETTTLVTLDSRNEDWKSLRWVMLARKQPWGEGDSNKVLRCLHVDNLGWTATDGHRLHRYTPVDAAIPPGDYLPLPLRVESKVMLAKTEEKYPNYQSVIPDREKAVASCECRQCLPSDDVWAAEDYTRILRLQNGNGPALNFRYLLDALQGEVNRVHLFEPAGSNGVTPPVLITGPRHTAVIMPMMA